MFKLVLVVLVVIALVGCWVVYTSTGNSLGTHVPTLPVIPESTSTTLAIAALVLLVLWIAYQYLCILLRK
jgi:hypothetical protein